MNQEDKANLKSKIEEMIIKYEADIVETEKMTQPVSPENSIGRVSRMDAINNKTINENALRKAENKLKNLELALSKVDEPDFGQCAKCKGEIPIQRVMLVPQSRYCVNCAR